MACGGPVKPPTRAGPTQMPLPWLCSKFQTCTRCCAVLCCAALCCAVLFCAVLCYAVRCRAVCCVKHAQPQACQGPCHADTDKLCQATAHTCRATAATLPSTCLCLGRHSLSLHHAQLPVCADTLCETTVSTCHATAAKTTVAYACVCVCVWAGIVPAVGADQHAQLQV